MEWISIKDKLPVPCNMVLVVHEDKEIYIGNWTQSYKGFDYNADFNRHYNDRQNPHADKVITHWMPLPNPPKE